MKVVLILLNILVLTSAWAGKLIIKSQPEGAEIYVQSEGSKAAVIGKTPFEADLNEISNTYVKASSFMIELQKPGHMPYRVLIARTSEVDLSLTANLEPNEENAKLREHDLLISELFDVQRLIRGRSFPAALTKLDQLEAKYPKFSTIPEMKATAYYLNKDVESALAFYRKAFMLNPDNDDSYRMKLYLENKLGVQVGSK